MPTIAKGAMGFCACGVQIEEGETIESINGVAVHVGCVPKKETDQPAAAITAPSDPVGFLFTDFYTDAEREKIESCKQTINVNHISFDGPSAMGIDTPRLAGQLEKVYTLMKDGKWRTLSQIATATGCIETSASSRMRDFRKSRFGGHTVNMRKVEGTTGLHEFQLILNERTDHEQQAA